MRYGISLFAAILFSSAAPIAAKDQVPINQPSIEPDWRQVRQDIEQYITTRLVDPDSARFAWTNGFRWGDYKQPFGKRMWGWLGCGTVNARNRMGGYTGQTSFVVVYNDGVIFTDSDANYSFSQIARYCQKASFPPAQPAFNEALPTTVRVQSVAEEIGKLSVLREKGIITESEYQAQKAKLLRQ